MAEAVTTLTKLLIVREIQEDDKGTTLCFHQGSRGRLAGCDVNYATSLQLARRSQERQHPVGVRLGEGEMIAELIRADNDVPMQLCEENADGVRVFFLGHDGVFHLKGDHPEAACLRAVLDEAIRRKARLWFIARKPDLTLVDLLPAGGASAAFHTCDGNGSSPGVKDR